MSFECPHCGFVITNPKRICPKCRNDISVELEEERKEAILGWIDFFICAPPTLLIMFIFSKLGVTLDFLGNFQGVAVILVCVAIFGIFRFVIFRDIIKRIRSEFERIIELIRSKFE
jgi:hypothetical protein